MSISVNKYESAKRILSKSAPTIASYLKITENEAVLIRVEANKIVKEFKAQETRAELNNIGIAVPGIT